MTRVFTQGNLPLESVAECFSVVATVCQGMAANHETVARYDYDACGTPCGLATPSNCCILFIKLSGRLSRFCLLSLFVGSVSWAAGYVFSQLSGRLSCVFVSVMVWALCLAIRKYC
jgi:hypothetical protein